MSHDEVADIEREIARTRNRLDATLDNIHDRMNLAALVDEAGGMLAGSSAHRMGQQALRVARENPLPAAVVILGLSWLVRQYISRTYDDAGYRPAPEREHVSRQSASDQYMHQDNRMRMRGNRSAAYATVGDRDPAIAAR